MSDDNKTDQIDSKDEPASNASDSQMAEKDKTELPKETQEESSTPTSEENQPSTKSADTAVENEKTDENNEEADVKPDQSVDPKSKNEPEPSKENTKAEDEKEESIKSTDNEDGQDVRKPIADPTKNAHWYVVHTYSGHEKKVATTLKQRIESLKLQDKILDIIIPTQEKIEIKEGKKNTVKEKIFPGYLLVNMIMDDNSWIAVRTTPGITGFIGTSTKPTPLPEEEVATIKRYMTMEAPKFKTTFTQGEAIKITDGPFNEFLGTISEIDEEKGKIKVMVSVFGRETPVELDLLQVAKL